MMRSPAADGTRPTRLVATGDAQRKPALQAAAAKLLGHQAPVLHLALGWPDDLAGTAVAASVSTLGCGFEAVALGVRVLAGLAKAEGKLVG